MRGNSAWYIGKITALFDEIEGIAGRAWLNSRCTWAGNARSRAARCATNTGCIYGRFAALAVKLVSEAVALAQARGITLVDQSPIPVMSVAHAQDLGSAIEVLREVGRTMLDQAPSHRMSALQDLEAGRRLEVHETLGYAAREALRLQVSAPTIALCYEIVSAIDSLPRAA